MAVALFEAHGWGRRDPIRVASAGVAARTGLPPPEPVVALLAERGLDVAAHRAQQFTGALGSGSDLVLVMEAAQKRFIEKNWPALKGRVRRLGEWRNEDVHDPYGQPTRVYADCLAHLEACLDDWHERLLA